MVRNVLFVDDDQIMLLAIEKRFAKHADHFSMIMANDGFEAVQKLKESAISLIVLDLKMPRMDGMSLLSHTREKYPDIPVIIVSGYRTAEMYKLAKSKGVIAYISKPFQVDDLGKIILSTLQKESEGGIMHNVSPTVFLQLMEMEAKTCTIRVLDKKSGMGGILYFLDGNLLDVRVGSIKGLDAAYRVFSWDEVTLFIQNECSSRENKINSDLQPIIMKAVGMKDENEEVAENDEVEEIEVQASELLIDSNEDLGSLDLPEEFFDNGNPEMELERGAVPSAAPVVNEAMEAPKPEVSKIDKIQEILMSEVGQKSGLEDIHHDESLGEVVDFLNELGSLFDFGRLKVGYIDNGEETDKIILPGEPITVLEVNQKCPQDKMVTVLSQYV